MLPQRQILSGLVKPLDLFLQVTRGDLKSRYRRSVLGLFWLFGSPLLTSAVLIAAFAGIFRPPDQPLTTYAAYVMSGVVFIQFVNGSVTTVASSLMAASGYITKVRTPSLLYPASSLAFSIVGLSVGLIYVLLLSGMGGHTPTLMLPLALLGILALCFGVGLILCVVRTRLDDTAMVIPVVLQSLTYLTPIFYPQSIWPEQLAPFLSLNPLVPLLGAFRLGLGIDSEPVLAIPLAGALSFSVLSLFLGLFVHIRTWPRSVARL